MDREKIAKLFTELLVNGKAFAANLEDLNEISEEDSDAIDQLIADGDEEFVAFNNEFASLEEKLDW